MILTGPTGSGKSQISFTVAGPLDAEIVCADSRQIYRGLEIGSAAPAERRGIRQHLFGVLRPDEKFSAGAYRDMARRVIDSIHERGKVPLLVGGTGLYLEAVTGEISLAPPLEPETFRALRSRLENEGAPALHQELASRDPDAARAISPNDPHRVIRALGILMDTGKTQSSYASRQEPAYFPAAKVALNVRRELLYARIDDRCRQMFKDGVLSEASKLKSAGYGSNLPALKSIGYRYLYAVLEGSLPEADAIDLMSRDTRRYAKRQMTWLRGRSGIAWIDAEDPEAAAQSVISKFKLALKEEKQCE